MTNFENIKSMNPSKLAVYMRKTLAGNQGCPPCSLMQVFAHCNDHNSCDECWWKWLLENSRPTVEEGERTVTVVSCEKCRWGAVGDTGHPFVACMHPRFYGAVMEPDDYCSESLPKYVKSDELKLIESAKKWALRMGKMSEEEAAALALELKRKGELEALNEEVERRQAVTDEPEEGS